MFWLFSGGPSRASRISVHFVLLRVAALPVLALLFICEVHASDYYVDATGGNDTYDGLAAVWNGASGPKATIQAGINASSSGDTVTVAQGTYLGAIDFTGRNITVRSMDPTNSAVVTGTVINGGGDPAGTPANAVTFILAENAQAVLTGFTVTTDAGRGIYCFGASPTISYCHVVSNISYAGGGFLLSQSNASIVNCLIRDNMTGMDGAGGIYSEMGAPTIQNCTVADNSCGMGGASAAIHCYDSSPLIRDCILWGNSCGGGLNTMQITCTGTSVPTICGRVAVT